MNLNAQHSSNHTNDHSANDLDRSANENIQHTDTITEALNTNVNMEINDNETTTDHPVPSENVNPNHFSVQPANSNQPKPVTEIWKIMYANIRGLKGKRSSLIEHIDNEKPQILTHGNTASD